MKQRSGEQFGGGRAGRGDGAFVKDLADTDIRAASSSADQQRLPAPPGASPIAGEIFDFSGTQAWRDYKSLSLNTFEATA